MTSTTPIFVTFHVEPDDLYLRLNQREPWKGFETAFKLIQELRDNATISDSMKFIWLVRADHQIETVYKNASWGLDEYLDEFSKLVQRGDELGIHVHPYRLKKDSETWIQDFSDEDWICECVSKAHKSYTEKLSKSPLYMSIGPNSTSTKVINHCRDLGIQYDFTPSRNGKKTFNQAPGEINGEMNFMEHLPDSPYFPSRDDMTKTDQESTDYLLIPVPYFMKKHGFLNSKGFAKKILLGQADYRRIKLSLTIDPATFKDFLNSAKKRKLQYLVVDTRTHAFEKATNRANIAKNLALLSSMQGKDYDVKVPQISDYISSL